jgi:Ca2+-binding RTX toxin-like protein
VFSVSGSGGSATVTSAAVTVAITNAEPANNKLTINTSSGDDIVGASQLANSSVQLTVNGGGDNDVIVGSQGNDTINGDEGDDVLLGGNGNDTMGGGTGTDYIDGGAGTDSATGGETVVNVP